TLAACGTAVPSSGASTSSGTPAPSAVPATEAPAVTAGPMDTEEPVDTEEPTETEGPSETIDPSASPGASSGPAAACSGSDANREFYDGVAAAVDWTVLCAVLPKGWYVSTGSYRLANGGKLVIGYKGPGGSTLHLSEGAFCVDGSDCMPAGTEGGEVPLGPMTGTLVRQADGGFSIVVDRGLNPSWLLETNGLDEAATLAIGSALAVVTPQE
ncbi:MAG: hypothetical protein MUQ32_07175, partial [Chloroflexi bacterium]|nr:hypothetical protein [Chloroflexota bacterium]